MRMMHLTYRFSFPVGNHDDVISSIVHDDTKVLLSTDSRLKLSMFEVKSKFRVKKEPPHLPSYPPVQTRLSVSNRPAFLPYPIFNPNKRLFKDPESTTQTTTLA